MGNRVKGYFGLGGRPDVAREMYNSLFESSSVLEIGCGVGDFRDHFDESCTYWGVERDGESAKRAVAKLDKVLIGDVFESLPEIPDGLFELIVCNDVIEHIDDTDRLLTELGKKLVPGGAIVGSIPNVLYCDNVFRLIVLRDWRYIDAGILDKTHLRFFTKKSFKRKASENGFETIRMEGINKMRVAVRSSRLLCYSLAMVITAAIIGGGSCFRQYYFEVRKELVE